MREHRLAQSKSKVYEDLVVHPSTLDWRPDQIQRTQGRSAMILHITTKNCWHEQTARGRAYRGDTLASEGFIHLSTRAQVLATADRFFNGQTGLLLVCVDEESLTSELRYEDPGDSTMKFRSAYQTSKADWTFSGKNQNTCPLQTMSSWKT